MIRSLPNKNDLRKTNGKPRSNGKGDSSKKPDEKHTRSSTVNNWFRKFAHRTSEIVGCPWSFILATFSLIVWAILGPAAGFSDTWQLIINTATTIVTFLMVFLIQNTQNRDAKAIHLKLDELIHSIEGARNKLINLEDLSEEELKKLQEHFKAIGKKTQRPPAKEAERVSNQQEPEMRSRI